ncbi:MAG: LON peptidase substrate-binding domain-containing protein [Gammaproteobacteria bacterium]|nr:LON peptidase substrate-binding domain-containing protein [Gammaproteobacteria bacterium]
MSNSGTASTPLFPLHSVLFPGGQLPLRIFEPRYLRMIRRCINNQTEFGVVLIAEGTEVGEAASTHPVGTFARVADWRQKANDLLQVTVVGQERFQVLSLKVLPDQLLVGETLAIEKEPAPAIPAGFEILRAYLDQALEELGVQDAVPGRYLNDARWVGHRLAELLPLPLAKKQWLLELTNPLLRLEALQNHVQYPSGNPGQSLPASIRDLLDD